MQLNEYQKLTLNTWQGDQKLIRAFFGVCGEAGELAERIKKYLRGDYDLEKLKEHSLKELGDILYYVSVTAHELGISLDDIGQANIAKLAKRYAEGKIKGEGDDR